MRLPDFSRFGRRENRGAQENFSDGFDDGFSDDSDSGGDREIPDHPSEGYPMEFNDGFSLLSDDFDDFDDFNDFNDFNDAPGYDGARRGMDGGSKIDDSRHGSKTDLKAAFTALFQAVSGRFSGREKSVRDAGVDGSDSMFADGFDSAVDDGFEPEQDSYPEANRDLRDPEPAYHGEPGVLSEAPPVSFDNEPYGGNEYDGMSDFPSEFSDLGYSDPDSEVNHEEDEGSDPDGSSSGRIDEGEASTEGTMHGVFAAMGAAFSKFRRRLPGFRPKVYVLPEPEYTPEDDGIGTPTLASDIKKILEEQNKPGETEQEYERMRNYISEVSTDARIRPGDIKAPENIGEVRAAEGELYSLIDAMIYTNEQQRSRIGVYEAPPEEDPYNFRGINNDRQYYSDMEVYSFDMQTRYGFESEEKIDPGRKYAELEYSERYYDTLPEPTGQEPEYADNRRFSDGAAGDYSDSEGTPPHDGFSYNAASDGLSDEEFGLDDDFGDDVDSSVDGIEDGSDADRIHDPVDERFNSNSFDDYFSKGFDQSGPDRSGRHYVNSDSNPQYGEGSADDRSMRSGGRTVPVRRRARR